MPGLIDIAIAAARARRAALVLAAVGALLVAGSRPARAQTPPRPEKQRLELAFYAPSLPFKDTASRLSYLRTLADAIASNTGHAVEPRLYSTMTQLRKSNPDFAIVEAQCLSSSGWRPLASARIGGKTSRGWSLYAARGQTLATLRGKKLAYSASGCRDDDFIENALFESEIRLSYFAGTSAKSTIGGAVAEVTSVRAAAAVFAPEGQAGGLSALFEAGEVANPVLVAASAKLSKDVVEEVGRAARRFGSSGVIDGWSDADDRALTDLRRRMRGARRHLIMAEPTGERLPYRDLLAPERGESSAVSVRRYFDTGERRPAQTATARAEGQGQQAPAAPAAQR